MFNSIRVLNPQKVGYTICVCEVDGESAYAFMFCDQGLVVASFAKGW